MRRMLLLALSLTLSGCGGSAQQAAVPLDQVPPAFVETAKKKLPEVKFEQAVKRADGSYEIRGRDKQGKVRDVELDAKGEVTEVE